MGEYRRLRSAKNTVFILCQPNFMRTLATMVENSLLLFLGIGQVLKYYDTLNFFTWE